MKDKLLFKDVNKKLIWHNKSTVNFRVIFIKIFTKKIRINVRPYRRVEKQINPTMLEKKRIIDFDL